MGSIPIQGTVYNTVHNNRKKYPMKLFTYAMMAQLTVLISALVTINH